MKEYTPEEIAARRKERRRGGRKTKLNPKEWADVQTKYEQGYPIKQIAEKYEMKPQSISQYAKRHGWLPHGALREEAISKARKKIERRLEDSYDSIVKEINDKHLRDFRVAAEIARGLLADIAERIRWARGETERRREIAKKEGLPTPAPISTAKEAYSLIQVINGLRTVLIDGERYILGIKEGSLNGDSKEGIKEMTRVLSEAREKYEGEPEAETTPEGEE